MRAIDVDYFVKEWMPKHLEWDFYDMDTMYYDDEWQAELPIIEAEPLRHGHWEMCDEAYNAYKCSICHDAWAVEEGTPAENNMHYCQNCGAKMDEEAEK